jgi:3-dehydroquinate dehydratase
LLVQELIHKQATSVKNPEAFSLGFFAYNDAGLKKLLPFVKDHVSVLHKQIAVIENPYQNGY